MSASKLRISRVKRNGGEPTVRIAVLGGGHVGATLARHLGDGATTVVFLDPDPIVVESAESAGVTAHEADVTSAQDLDRHGIDATDLAVVASDSDAANLLTAQLVRVRFGVERTVVRVNDPRNRGSFERLDFESVCASSTLADRIGETVRNQNSNTETARELA